LIPWIGHTGITDSKGNLYDFAGPYSINYNEFAFGKELKYVDLNKDGNIDSDLWN